MYKTENVLPPSANSQVTDRFEIPSPRLSIQKKQQNRIKHTENKQLPNTDMDAQ